MTHRIVVLGAGYAGLTAGRRLARATKSRDVRIDLVNATPSFVERVRLHQLSAATGTVERPLAEIVSGSGIHVTVGRVVGLDAGARTVAVDRGGDAGRDTLDYDTLVYALGSRTAVRSVPGVAEHAYTLDGADGAGRLAGAVDHIATSGGNVVVCGGGLTGVEAAAELAEARPELRVTLVTSGEIGHSLSATARAYVRQVYQRIGVRLLEQRRVSSVTASAVLLSDGTEVPADATVWCGAFEVPGLARDAGLDVESSGRIRVDETLRSLSHPDVYAVGDAASVPLPWGPQRMSCQAGAPTGSHAADAIVTRLAGGEPVPFRFRYGTQCVSLGRRDGLIQLVHADDSPSRIVVTGRIAARIKELICRSAAWSATTGRLSDRALYPWPYAPAVRRVQPQVRSVVSTSEH
ncbi:MAG: FAD-dependent oxidoreductase [Actinocatenispora sp.]